MFSCSVLGRLKEAIIAEPLSLTVSLRGTREVKDTHQTFRLTGLLDAFSEPTFRKVVSDHITDGPSHIVLDLSKIDFLDSSGLGALVQLAKQAKTQQGSLQIVTNSRVTQTVKLVRLEKFLPLHNTLDEAIAAVTTGES
jgi:anti-anti-sigma factor